MDKNKQPGITFENIILKKIEFSRNKATLEKPEIEFNFTSDVNISEDKKNMSCELTCSIVETKNQFSVSCSMIGYFSCDEDNQNMELDKFAETNAPALIIPYIRESISSLTVKSGMPPLLIPPMNVVAMVNEQKENQK